MISTPKFPRFKVLELSDRAILHPLLWSFRPTTSELTFTNLYMWRFYYKFRWCLYEGERCDKALADQFMNDNKFTVTALDNHFDYVYRRSDLVALAGRRYHSKRNHISQFVHENSFKRESSSIYFGRTLKYQYSSYTCFSLPNLEYS